MAPGTTPVVLVTGCSSGIGRATARRFLAADWRVWATARDPADISDLADAGCRTAAQRPSTIRSDGTWWDARLAILADRIVPTRVTDWLYRTLS